MRNDFVEIFDPCLQEIKMLMRNQLISAWHAGNEVKVRYCSPLRCGHKAKLAQKVILIGGFGTARSLQSSLRDALNELSREFRYTGGMRLITTRDLSRQDPYVIISIARLP